MISVSNTQHKGWKEKAGIFQWRINDNKVKSGQIQNERFDRFRKTEREGYENEEKSLRLIFYKINKFLKSMDPWMWVGPSLSCTDTHRKGVEHAKENRAEKVKIMFWIHFAVFATWERILSTNSSALIIFWKRWNGRFHLYAHTRKSISIIERWHGLVRRRHMQIQSAADQPTDNWANWKRNKGAQYRQSNRMNWRFNFFSLLRRI